MKRFLHLTLTAALALAACQKNEKSAEPSVFRVSPKSALSESGFAHELQIMVTCDVPFSYTLEDGSWIEISASVKDASNLTTLSLALEANEGELQRSDVLHIKAGSQKADVEIAQKPLSSAVPVNEVQLRYVFPAEVTFNFPEDWSVSPSESWIEADRTSGKAGQRTAVTIRATQLNLTDSPRKGELRFTFAKSSISIPVVQESSLPSGAFAENVYGIYNYNGLGASVTHEPLSFQTNLVRRNSGNLFRIVDPAEGRFIEIGGLTSSCSVSDSLRLVMYQNWTPDIEFRTETDAWVLKKEGEYVWLMSPELTGFVVKN